MSVLAGQTTKQFNSSLQYRPVYQFPEYKPSYHFKDNANALDNYKRMIGNPDKEDLTKCFYNNIFNRYFHQEKELDTV